MTTSDETVEATADNEDPCCEECWAWRTGEPILMRSSATGATVKVLPEFIDAYLDAGWKATESETKGREVNPRDELAKLLTETSRAYIGEYGAYVDEVEAPHLADAILAAGYKKPRAITTVEELEALPVGSVILDTDPDTCRKNEYGRWNSLDDPEESFSSRSLLGSLPATVLHEPESAA
jgi:hypothetical protein